MSDAPRLTDETSLFVDALWITEHPATYDSRAVKIARAFLNRRAQQSEGAQAALQPFIEALEAIDKATSPDLMCEDAEPLGHALWTNQQPTVGELRRLVKAFSNAARS